ncbi:MAG: hypothetical protein ACK5PP_15665 [Acidimicrobiales bacterium]
MTCHLGTMGAGETATVQIGVLVGAGVVPGSLSNLARVWSTESSSETAATAAATVMVAAPGGEGATTPTAAGSLATTGGVPLRYAWAGPALLRGGRRRPWNRA